MITLAVLGSYRTVLCMALARCLHLPKTETNYNSLRWWRDCEENLRWAHCTLSLSIVSSVAFPPSDLCTKDLSSLGLYLFPFCCDLAIDLLIMRRHQMQKAKKLGKIYTSLHLLVGMIVFNT